MVRTGLLAALALALAPSLVFAQGSEEEPMYPAVWRVGKVETHSGKTLAGKILLKRVIVEQDEGRYYIDPKQVKAIELWKRGAEQSSELWPHGTVVTTSDKKFEGDVGVSRIHLKFDAATLILNNDIKTIAFEPGPEKKPKLEAKASQPKATIPSYTIVSAYGAKHGMTAYPMQAVRIQGRKIARIAAKTEGGDWVVQQLREPFEGLAEPRMLSQGVLYVLGRTVSVYRLESNDWHVVELSQNAVVEPIVPPASGTVNVWDGDRLYSFDFDSGKWSHVDFGAALGRSGDQSDKPVETKK